MENIRLQINKDKTDLLDITKTKGNTLGASLYNKFSEDNLITAKSNRCL